LTESVATLTENIGEIPDSVAGLSTQLSQLENNLESAQDSTGEMRAKLDQVEADLLRTQGKIVRWFFWGKLALAMLLLLVMVSQVGGVVQGVGMISGRQRAVEARLALLEARFQELEALE
jgi:t-SNARE complex subunit (syntaxin)